MGILKRIFGICDTKPPKDSGCWKYSENMIEVALDKVPELAVKGGAVRLEGGDLPEKVLVVNGNDDLYHAFINKCMHGKRRIEPVAGEQFIRCCSMGKATYNYNGEVVSGAAKEPLPVLKVEEENGRLKIHFH